MEVWDTPNAVRGFRLRQDAAAAAPAEGASTEPWARLDLPPWCDATYMRACAASIDWDSWWFQQGHPEAKVGLFLQSYRRFGVLRAFPPFMATASGPFRLGEPRKHWDAEGRLLRESCGALLEHLENRFDHILLYPDNWDMRMFHQRGWVLHPRWTVQHEHAHHTEFSAEVRRPLRKAREAGLHLVRREESHPESVALWTRFGEAFARTFVNQGRAQPWPAGSVERLTEALFRSGWLEGWCVCNAEGQPMAFGAMVREVQRGVWTLWYACSLPDADRSGAMTLLLHELIAEGRQRDHEFFDLGGVDHPSLAFFKEHFGNRLVQRFEAQWFRRGWIRLLMGLYRRLRA